MSIGWLAIVTAAGSILAATFGYLSLVRLLRDSRKEAERYVQDRLTTVRYAPVTADDPSYILDPFSVRIYEKDDLWYQVKRFAWPWQDLEGKATVAFRTSGPRPFDPGRTKLHRLSETRFGRVEKTITIGDGFEVAADEDRDILHVVFGFQSIEDVVDRLERFNLAYEQELVKQETR